LYQSGRLTGTGNSFKSGGAAKYFISGEVDAGKNKMLHHWDMSTLTADGKKLKDMVGDNDLVLKGTTASSTSCPVGGCMRIKSCSSWMESTSKYDDELGGKSPKTMMAWVMVVDNDGDGDGVRPLFGFGDNAGSCARPASTFAVTDHSSVHNAGVNAVGCNDDLASSKSTQLKLNVWYHIALTFDGSIARIYKDGQMLFEKEWAQDTKNSGMNQFVFGVDAWWKKKTHFMCDGYFDEGYVFNYAVDQTTIQALISEMDFSTKTTKDKSYAVPCTNDAGVNKDGKKYQCNNLSPTCKAGLKYWIKPENGHGTPILKSVECEGSSSASETQLPGWQLKSGNMNALSRTFTQLGSKANPAKSCEDMKERSPHAKTGPTWIIAPGDSQRTIKVYCDQSTLGGGWTRVASLGDTSVPEGDFVDLPDDDDEKYAFSVKWFKTMKPTEMMVENTSPPPFTTNTDGKGDYTMIRWGDDPPDLKDYTSNKNMEFCGVYRRAAGNTGSGWHGWKQLKDCRYSMHSEAAGCPWCNSMPFGFTQGNMMTGYTGNAAKRVLLGMTISGSDSRAQWYNFGGNTNTRNSATSGGGSWGLQAGKRGYMYMRRDPVPKAVDVFKLGVEKATSGDQTKTARVLMWGAGGGSAWGSYSWGAQGGGSGGFMEIDVPCDNTKYAIIVGQGGKPANKGKDDTTALLNYGGGANVSFHQVRYLCLIERSMFL